ncbi:MAG: isochorismate synthase [bacterium]
MNTKAGKKSLVWEKNDIRREVIRAFKECAQDRDNTNLIRLEIPVKEIDPLLWLYYQPFIRTYWSSRDQNFEMAGAGQADLIFGQTPLGYKEIFRRMDLLRVNSNRNFRYYGGFRFNQHARVGGEWNAFGMFRFILPRFEIIKMNNNHFFVCNAVSKSAKQNKSLLEEIIGDFEKISFDLETRDNKQNSCRERNYVPDKNSWLKSAKAVLDVLHGKCADKIVLARKADFTFTEPLQPLDVLCRLKSVNPKSYHFCFQAENGASFIGGTPERLYARKGLEIKSEALAATRTRGESPLKDQQLKDELLTTDKDRKEHYLVYKNILEALKPLCEHVNGHNQATVLQLPRIQHLYSRIAGKLKPAQSDGDILGALHPTPAVGGCPREVALEKISQLEPFDRGWFAGPVGWTGRESADFAVAIRSGLIRKNMLSLYCGAGVVIGSSPQAEWEEIENKLSNLMHIFNCWK